jgi:two-component system, chemotaxis family, CheB/CheR fusion protein
MISESDQIEQGSGTGDTGARTDLLPVVGIGASAGGLGALRELLKHLPSDSGLAFVVVVHLSPEHESHLADLLQPHTRMPVQQISQTVPMEPDHVYVIPPGANLSAIDTHLRLTELEEQRRKRAPIDHFFRTLSEAHHETAVGVVLTGTGSDGTVGLKLIREKGGLTIVQDPQEAEYDGMPQSAIASGIVDLILPLAEMPAHIIRFATTQPDLEVPDDDRDVDHENRQLVLKILAQVRARTGHDFSRYKATTIMRRIRRRMQMHHVEELHEYLALIRDSRDEAKHLFDDLLINVTNFFRDRETFDELESEILPRLFEGKGPGDRVRVWSVGCATGEEAYSLAILLLEQAAKMEDPPDVQVFASDIHEPSLQKARDGIYPETIETDVPADRLRRFFAKENNHFRVRREVREVVVFAPHNLMKDPPFSHVHLITCRNVLIYLQRDVQKDILALFHYALNPDGYLVLGSSETTDRLDLFRSIDKAHCIYRRRNVPAPEPRLPVFPMAGARVTVAERVARRHEHGVSYGGIHQKMVERYAPPSILVNQDDAVVHFSEHAGQYLTHPGGEPTSNVYRLVREPLRVELRSCLFGARERGRAERSRPIELDVDGRTAHLVLRVQPATDDELKNFYLVIFDEVEGPKGFAKAGTPDDGGIVVRELEEELERTRERMQGIIEEYESSQEEMKASNEELQSMNEELRSTMEELETSKEELQSINEELATVNQENRHKVEELSQLSNDLQNLLAATDIATLFLDRELRIMRFTPPLGELFNVLPADRGRPISDLTHRLGDGVLIDDAQQVLDSLVPVDREIRIEDGKWFVMRIRPYRSTDNRIDGVVITFIDLTDQKQREEDLRRSEERFRLVVESAREFAIFTLDTEGHIVTWNPGAQRITGYREEEILGEHVSIIFTEEDREAGIARVELETAARDGQAPDERWHRCKDGTRFWANGVVVALYEDDGTLRGFAKLMEDETDKKYAEDALRESERRYRTLFESIDEGFCVIEVIFDEDEKPVDYRFLEVNPAFERHTDLKDAVNRTIRELAPQHEEHWFEVYGRIARTGTAERFVSRAEQLNGRWFDVYAFRLGGDGSQKVAVLFKDITEQRRTLQELEGLNRTLEERVEERTREVQHLASTLTMAEQEERRRIARVLHDDLQQMLFGVHLRLDHLTRDVAELHNEQLQQEFDQLGGWVLHAIESTRELAIDLSPPILKNEGLCEALGWLASQMREKHNLEVKLTLDEELRILDEDLRSLLFQVVRELLFNVIKHANVQEAAVTVARANGRARIEVRDHGIGFDIEKVEETDGREGGGFGLFSVRERLRLIGGRMEIESTPGDGTRVEILAPVNNRKSRSRK